MSDLNDINDAPKSEPQDEARTETSAETQAAPMTLPRAEPPFREIHKAATDDAPAEPDESPRLDLMLWPKGPQASEAPPQPKPRAVARWPLDPLGLAAGVAAAGFVAVSLFAGYDHFHQTALVAVKAQENQDIVKSVATLKTRLEAIETMRSQEQTTELRKTLLEVKAAAQSAQGVTAALGQLAQRVDKVEKEQGARIEKLGEKLEQAASNRNAELVARLEKLEKRPVTVAAAPSAPLPPAAKASTSPGVSNETTGSIEKPKPVLRGYMLNDVRGNVAFLESREGPMTVTPGDMLPGAGRVLRIERHGQNWVVVTSQGVITSPDDNY